MASWPLRCCWAWCSMPRSAGGGLTPPPGTFWCTTLPARYGRSSQQITESGTGLTWQRDRELPLVTAGQRHGDLADSWPLRRVHQESDCQVGAVRHASAAAAAATIRAAARSAHHHPSVSYSTSAASASRLDA